MIDPKDAKKLVIANINKASKEDLEKSIEASISKDKSCQTGIGGKNNVTQLTLFRPSDTPLPLNAYLASALTGLDKDQRSLVFQLSDTISLICEKHGIDLYEPRKKTDPVHHPDVNDKDVFMTDRERVLSSDLLIFLSHYPSTGAGQELDFAYSAMLPIIIISRNADKVSRMVTGIPTFTVHLQYDEPEELRSLFDNCLDTIKPVIEERKLAFSSYKQNIVGQRIRTLREQLGLSRDDVVSMAKTITKDELKKLEESSDKVSNPSLMQLRQIAVILKTTVADLVEPDTGSRIISFLNDWLEGRQAARYSSISDDDTRKIMRRVLLRVVDSLEK
jgi:transcriptional regulator with XRE-family HTH domain